MSSMRLTKITTRTGDEGDTGLGNGARGRKSDLRIGVMGDVDELNCATGLILAETVPQETRLCLEAVQHDLFELGAELCLPGETRITASHVSRLEAHLDGMNSNLPHLAEFILPGGTRAAALCHMARTIARRAERSLVALSGIEPVGPYSLKYLNRLSDLLFVAARAINRSEACPDVLWKSATS